MPTIQDDVSTYIERLENRLLDIELKFIGQHTDPSEPAAKYALDVQSYAVLCHAAFEEFAETLCQRILDEIDERLINHIQFSKATLCLLHFDIDSISHSVDKWDDSSGYYDNIKNEIRDRKSKLSAYAMKLNHGVGIKYLHSLFLPIGLDMPQGVNEKNSLEQLVKLRGFYAHAHTLSRPNAITISSTKTATDYVYDVLGYMNKVAQKAKSMSYYNW